MAEKWSPGPWQVFVEPAFDESGDMFRISKEYPCINGLSAWFTLAKVYEPDESERGYTDGVLDRNVAEANAQLIAAAPDMYAALDEAEACMSIVEPRSDKAEYLRILGVVRAALAKAEGA